MSGCMFQKANINGHEDHLITFDQAQVTSTQQDYHNSVLNNGLYSAQTVGAESDMTRAQHKLDIDERDYDQYRSASGQDSVPGE